MLREKTRPVIFNRKSITTLGLLLTYENVYGDKLEKIFEVGSTPSLGGTKIKFTQIKKD